MTAMKVLRAATCTIALLAVAGCTYYAPAPYPTTAPTSFDRSFAAAGNALREQGVAVSVEDRATGSISGNAGGTPVSASVRQQADGSVRVQFDSRDSALAERVSRSYERFMGR
jgi:hypothetical protein